VNALANLLLTQGDARYVGGVTRLKEMLPVRAAFASPIIFRSAKYREAVAELEKTSRLCKCATNGWALIPWTILHPNSSDRFASAEDNAVVAYGAFDSVRVLLVSDLGKAGQNAVFTRHPGLRADVIVAGLPEKGEPLAEEWLQALAPKLIVLADAEVPATRRASAPLLTRLRRQGATVLVTRQAGAVTLRIRAGKWRVETAWPLGGIESISKVDTDNR
jgi:beta-lactamase superfamily II metal-dependent hydrolase